MKLSRVEKYKELKKESKYQEALFRIMKALDKYDENSKCAEDIDTLQSLITIFEMIERLINE